MERDRKNLEEACAFAEKLGDQRRLAQTLYWLGRHHYVLAQLELAIKFARQSLEIADALDDAALAAPPVNLMGRAYWQLSDYVRSAEMMERSVEQMRTLGNKSEESTAAGFLSGLLGYMGDFDKALAYCDRGITLAQELKNPYTEAATLHYRGLIRDQQGQWDLALADYAAAREIAEPSGDLFRVYLIKFMQGRAYHVAGDRVRGRTLIEESIALAAQLGTTFILGQAKTMLAACALAEGEGADESVRSLCAEAIGLAEKAGDKFTVALALRAQAESLSRSRSPEERGKAKPDILEAIRLLEEIGAKPELGRSYVSLAAILEIEGNTAEATTTRQRAIRLFGQLGMEWDSARATLSRHS
jgi:tetratricopeptide (TPR) repeat protein